MEPKKSQPEATKPQTPEEYYQARREEIAGQIASMWIKYGQAAKDKYDAEQQIIKLSNRVDELERIYQAAQKPKE